MTWRHVTLTLTQAFKGGSQGDVFVQSLMKIFETDDEGHLKMGYGAKVEVLTSREYKVMLRVRVRLNPQTRCLSLALARTHLLTATMPSSSCSPPATSQLISFYSP